MSAHLVIIGGDLERAWATCMSCEWEGPTRRTVADASTDRLHHEREGGPFPVSEEGDET